MKEKVLNACLDSNNIVVSIVNRSLRCGSYDRKSVAARDQYFLDVCRLVSVLWTACAETSRSACVDIVRKIYRHIERRRIL